MPAFGFIKSAYLRYLSRPSCDRGIYRTIVRQKLTNIVELGVGHGTRAERMIQLSQRGTVGVVRYTGVDLFEARSEPDTGLTLKEAHRRFRKTGAKVQLSPGDPFSALARLANNLTGTQLLIIGADQDAESLDRAWFYVPRMLAEDAHVFQEQPSKTPGSVVLKELSLQQITELAGSHRRRRLAA